MVTYHIGAQGTFFPVEATDLPPEAEVTIFVNDRILEEDVQINMYGHLQIILDTTEADWGHYTATIVMVAGDCTTQLTFEFELVEGAALIPIQVAGISDETPKIVRIPPGLVRSNQEVYLPVVMR